jgi:hypothetical protein
VQKALERGGYRRWGLLARRLGPLHAAVATVFVPGGGFRGDVRRQPVVRGTQVRVEQDAARQIDVCHALARARIFGIQIRVTGAGSATVGGADLGGCGRTCDAEEFVKIISGGFVTKTHGD